MQHESSKMAMAENNQKIKNLNLKGGINATFLSSAPPSPIELALRNEEEGETENGDPNGRKILPHSVVEEVEDQYYNVKKWGTIF